MTVGLSALPAKGIVEAATSMSTPRYYYANATQESIGPLELAALQALAQTGVISPNTPVIAEGEAAWSTAGQLGLLPPKKKRSLLRNVSMGCAGVFVGYLAIAVLAIIVLQALGSKVAPHEAGTSVDSQLSTGQRQGLDPEELRFEGYCVNETYGAKAAMTLALHQAPNGFVGELTLTGDLSGGGPLTGHIDDNKVYFTSRSEDGLEITWVGELQDDRIVGRYAAPNSAAQRQQTGQQTQEGRWEVKRKP